MFNNQTHGDDYSGQCPHCRNTMNIGHITKANKLVPGHVDVCNKCSKEFIIAKIDYIPVVWFRKREDNETS